MASNEITRRVVYIFRKYPRTRNDDRILAEKYFNEFYPHEFLYDGSMRPGALQRMINQDHLVRTRGHLQNDHNLYLPTTPVARKNRKRTDIQWNQWIKIVSNKTKLNEILNSLNLL
jgi:hypothetical protein